MNIIRNFYDNLIYMNMMFYFKNYQNYYNRRNWIDKYNNNKLLKKCYKNRNHIQKLNREY